MTQNILTTDNGCGQLDAYFEENGIRNVFLVCGKSFFRLNISRYFQDLEFRKGIRVIYFSDFKPNPCYTSVVKGVKKFRESKCDSIIAVGGGSAIDVAKCIKLYAHAASDQIYLKQEAVPNNINLLAIPTTAGSGSEATRYAVVYYQDEKQSISDNRCLPSSVVLDASALTTLPDYQRKATMMDAFCHALESFWSVHSTDESKMYSRKAIKGILANKDAYLSNDAVGNRNMLYAANLSGRAINITQTTAGHAMCYKLTTLCGIAHGHAAALCVSRLWPYMIGHTDKCIDPRGIEYLKKTFDDIAEIMECKNALGAAVMFQDILDKLELKCGNIEKKLDIEALKNSVNAVRLQNNPILLDKDTIGCLYQEIICDCLYSNYE